MSYIIAILAIISALVIASLTKKESSKKKPSGNLIIFDTETNGFPTNWNASPKEITNWPRMVSIAWYKIDPTGTILNEQYHLIQPNGFTYKSEAIKIHSITQEYAAAHGTELSIVLNKLQLDVQDSKYLIAHNIDFDYAVVLCELVRMKQPIDYFTSLKQICTMKSSTDYCAIKTSRGNKYPKLEELYQKLFKQSLNTKHNSKTDAEACMKSFKALYNRNIIKF